MTLKSSTCSSFLRHRAALLLSGLLLGQCSLAYPQLPQLPLEGWSFAAQLADGSVQVKPHHLGPKTQAVHLQR